MSKLTIENDGSLVKDDKDYPAGSPAPGDRGSDRSPSVKLEESSALGSEFIRSKPLIELLKIAEVMGVISGWSISGPSLVLRRGRGNILVRAVDAGSLLVRLMAEKSADEGVCPVNMIPEETACS